MKSLKYTLLIFCFAILFLNTQCDEDDDVQPPCGQSVVVDSGFYQSAESDLFELTDFQIEGNCLNVNVSSSGCDGATWSLVLVDSGNVAESFPEQRYLKLVFSNDEECLAVISQERSFDLETIQVEGSNAIILNLEGLEEPIDYTY